MARAAAFHRGGRSVDTTPVRSDFSTTVFGNELVRAPATVMAGGIFLLFAGPFILNSLVGPDLAAITLRAGMWLLLALYVFVAVLFALKLRTDAKALWGYTVDHFAIGTWVAGTNVLARVVYPAYPLTSKGLTIVGWILAVLYGCWITTIVGRAPLFERVNGTVFLTTVALQSVVLTSVGFPAEPSALLLRGLLGLNVIGILIYGFWFGFICLRGVKRQIEPWVPVNNITHGALSISLLAAETLVAKLAAPPAFLLGAIQALWAITAFLFVAIFLVEVGLVVRGTNLFSFRVSNYARNFTYGMFFACTYYGGICFPGSLMGTLATQPVLLGLAVVVAAVNVWEFGRHLTLIVRGAVTPRLESRRG